MIAGEYHDELWMFYAELGGTYIYLTLDDRENDDNPVEFFSVKHEISTRDIL